MIKITATELNEVKILKPTLHRDDRGYLFESFNSDHFLNEVGKFNFVQDNESKSKFGVLRGLHFQIKPFEQSKLVRVVSGIIQDVAIDIRKDSPTYLNYVSIILSSKNKKQLFIPKGFAHGFLVLSKKAIVQYKMDNPYDKKSCRGIKYDDPSINIKWQLDKKLIKLSNQDSKLKYL